MSEKPLKKNDPHDASGEAWENAVKAKKENADMLSHRIYSLATGGLALSFTAISFIVGDNKLALGRQAPLIWALFLLCIILDTFSILYARYRASKFVEYSSNRIKSGEILTDDEANRLIEKYNKPVIVFNLIVFILVIVAIIWAALYCYCLLLSIS